MATAIAIAIEIAIAIAMKKHLHKVFTISGGKEFQVVKKFPLKIFTTLYFKFSRAIYFSTVM
jgi:hypothetical protein